MILLKRQSLRVFLGFAWLLLLVVSVGCSPVPDFSKAELLPGGVTTARNTTSGAYNRPAAHLSAKQRLEYFSGHSFFKNPWVSSPATTTARDGLGPIFNTNSCKACHVKNGRGSVEGEGIALRLGSLVPDADGIYLSDPVYGEQIQTRAVLESRPESSPEVIWHTETVTLNDGATVQLRKPEYRLADLAWGPLDHNTRVSARLAPAMIGLGLLEAIPQQAIVAHAAKQAALPTAGRVSWVIERRSGSQQLGRFGWKALQPSLVQQSAKAFQQDLGLNSSLYPESVCTTAQADCLALPTGVDEEMEVRERMLSMVEYYGRHVAVPAPRHSEREEFLRGRELFYATGCAACHQPSWQTEALADLPPSTIWPYTDLLLHDMGPGLAAAAGEGSVEGSEWRTPPLWGIGLAQQVNPDTGFLHDGRARTLQEAILWHGGQAESARQGYAALAKPAREDLLFFLEAL